MSGDLASVCSSITTSRNDETLHDTQRHTHTETNQIKSGWSGFGTGTTSSGTNARKELMYAW